jgi:hypothetical protein
MTFWEARAAAKENIRLFEARKTWRRYADEVDATTGETNRGRERERQRRHDVAARDVGARRNGQSAALGLAGLSTQLRLAPPGQKPETAPTSVSLSDHTLIQIQPSTRSMTSPPARSTRANQKVSRSAPSSSRSSGFAPDRRWRRFSSINPVRSSMNRRPGRRRSQVSTGAALKRLAHCWQV